jgi:hypothetical protein
MNGVRCDHSRHQAFNALKAGGVLARKPKGREHIFGHRIVIPRDLKPRRELFGVVGGPVPGQPRPILLVQPPLIGR